MRIILAQNAAIFGVIGKVSADCLGLNRKRRRGHREQAVLTVVAIKETTIGDQVAIGVISEGDVVGLGVLIEGVRKILSDLSSGIHDCSRPGAVTHGVVVETLRLAVVVAVAFGSVIFAV